MKSFVLDASMALAWFFPGQETAATRAVFVAAMTSQVHVPPLWFLEVSHAIVRAERRGDVTRAKGEAFISIMTEEVGIQEDRMPVAQVRGRAAELAREENLSAYDASYLELALRLGLPLATTDIPLRKAARRAGVLLVDEAPPPAWELHEEPAPYGVKKKRTKKSRA